MLLTVVCSVFALYLASLGIWALVDSIEAARVSTDIAQTKAQIDAIYSRNADFSKYLDNKAFLDSLIIPKFSVYLDDLSTKIPEGTRTQSIQISRNTLEQQEIYGLQLVLESIPPLHEISSVIETLSTSPYFKDISVASASVNTTSAGGTTFSYPISLTINPSPTPNGNSNTSAETAK